MLKIWNLANKGVCLRTIETPSQCGYATLTLDDAIIISGHGDGHLRFWDSKNGKLLHNEQQIFLSNSLLDKLRANIITSVNVSPNGQFVLIAGYDNVPKIIRISTKEVVQAFKEDGLENAWARFCWSPDGKYIAGGSRNGTVFVWDVADGRLVRKLVSEV